MKQKQASFLVRVALQSFAAVLIVGVLLRVFVFSSYVMSGLAMLPNIWPGDFLLAGKLGLNRLRRGDIVALRCPHSPAKNCLKRVIGLPGDRIEFRTDGVLVINEDPARREPLTGQIELEKVAGSTWLVWASPEEERTTGPTTAAALVVPPKHLYLLNDKRSILDDSRQWGPVQSELIEAKVLRIWLSLDWLDGAEVRSWPHVRWQRMFRGIN